MSSHVLRNLKSNAGSTMRNLVHKVTRKVPVPGSGCVIAASDLCEKLAGDRPDHQMDEASLCGFCVECFGQACRLIHCSTSQHRAVSWDAPSARQSQLMLIDEHHAAALGKEELTGRAK